MVEFVQVPKQKGPNLLTYYLSIRYMLEIFQIKYRFFKCTKSSEIFHGLSKYFGGLGQSDLSQIYFTFISYDINRLFAVRAVYIMEIVKITKLTKSYVGNARSDYTQI